ncbi:MAG: hypothetical protein Q9160_007111 [Pyrenula sp. 1 TL-2023]
MLTFLCFLVSSLIISSGSFAAVSLPSNRALQQRTNIDDNTCDDFDRSELIDALRRISAWADDAITAITSLEDALNPARVRRNRWDFERIFRRPANVMNRREVYRAYLIIRDETYRSLRDTRYQDSGLNRITLECQTVDGWDNPCDPFEDGRAFDYAISGGRAEHHLLLVAVLLSSLHKAMLIEFFIQCPPYFRLDRHLPRNEIEDSRVTVLMSEMLAQYPDFFLPHVHNTAWTFESYVLTRFAASMYIRRRDETRIDFPGFEDEEDRLWQEDEENADNDEPMPDIEEHDAWRYMYEDVELGPPGQFLPGLGSPGQGSPRQGSPRQDSPRQNSPRQN